MFCKKCGTKLDDGAKFCPKCGTAAAQETQPAGMGADIKERKPVNKKLLGIACGAAAVVLILIFVMGRLTGKPDSPREIAAKTPEKAAEQTFDCARNKATWKKLIKKGAILQKEYGMDLSEGMGNFDSDLIMKYGSDIMEPVMKMAEDAECRVTDIDVDGDTATVDLEIKTRDYSAYASEMDEKDLKELDDLISDDPKDMAKGMKKFLNKCYKHPGKHITENVSIDLVKEDGKWVLDDNMMEQYKLLSEILRCCMGEFY